MSGTAAPDPRIEPVAASITQYERHDAADRNTARRAVEAADAADRVAGVIRVRVDDATVEKAAAAMYLSDTDGFENWDTAYEAHRQQYRLLARAVLEALVTP